MNEKLFIGILSGTSLDQIDAGLFCFSPTFALVDQQSQEFPQPLRKRLQKLIADGAGALREIGQLDAEIGMAFAEICHTLRIRNGRKKIAAIGSHGITLWHEMRHPPYFTWQIGDPNRLAEACGLPVIADFRRRDVAAGGQGAPLASGFHRWLFVEHYQKQDIAILNLGGIANLTFLHSDKTLGFDCGPANALLDAWIQKEKNLPYDTSGAWAATGTVQTALLAKLLDDPYFTQTPPKSTGKEYFSLAWLQQKLGKDLENTAAVDIQATLTAFTAQSIARAITDFSQRIEEIYFCGGGVHNLYLIQELRLAMPNKKLQSTQALGLAPEWVEAATFAWLAYRHDQEQSGNLPSVTGAAGERALGVYLPS